jgi:hypothetical protein
MALVVGVHGIGQQNSDAERQRTVWYDSLRLGANAAQLPQDAVPELAVPFYGSLFREGSEYLGAHATAPGREDEEAFIAAAFEEATIGWSDEELTELVEAKTALGPPALVPPWLLRGPAVIDSRWGTGAARLFERFLRQVHAYLFRESAAKAIRELVLAEIDEDTRVLVGHSLGSVVVYDLVRRGLARQVTTLVTLGSPLPWGTVRRALRKASPDVAALESINWCNVFDPSDVITAGRGLAPDAVDLRVDNGRADPHALRNYLGRKETAQVIIAGASPAVPV